MKLLIKNGRIIDPKTEKDYYSDIFIENGIIKKIDENIEMLADETIDAKGKVVAPGFVDIHVHLREPGFSNKETIKSGTQAAAAGGVTTLACMPNTKPAIHDKEVVKWINEKSEKNACVNVKIIGAITEDIAGNKLSKLKDMIDEGIVGVSDDGKTTMNSDLMREALKIIKGYDIPLISHAEDHSISLNGCMNEGARSRELGLIGIPEEAENKIVKRDISLAEEIGAKLHIAHVSTKTALEYIKDAKERGVKVTCEVAPHHFALNDQIVYKDNAYTKVNPPLRSEGNRQAVLKAIEDGIVDVIATDHAPHDENSKKCKYEDASFGISGIETLFSVSYTELVSSGKISLIGLLKMLTYKPAEIIGLDKGLLEEGKTADLVILDLEKSYKIMPDKFFSQGKNTPFKDYDVKGEVFVTIVNGKVVYQGGQILC